MKKTTVICDNCGFRYGAEHLFCAICALTLRDTLLRKMLENQVLQVWEWRSEILRVLGEK